MELQWNSRVDLATVERILGVEWVRGIIRDKSVGFCLGRAAGAWDANDREGFVAYSSLARIMAVYS